jgi:hypothetical protein
LNTDPALGIELEYEDCNMDFPDMNFWRAEADGSLRNSGIEYISVPLLYNEVEEALLEAEQVVEHTHSTSTERCGLHTHINMRPYTVGQVWSFAAAYALIEPTIYTTFAVDREDSVFGVPLWTNQPQVSALYQDICNLRSLREGGRVPAPHIVSTCKYSALNFSSLHNLGTVEMRQPYCSNDFQAIRIWLEFCIRLHTFGISFEDPDHVLDMYEREGLPALQEKLFGAVYDIDIDLQERAEDAAYFITGYTEPHWEDLDWDIEETA